ncbi:MAG: hypothetical protein LC723_11215, partial [Actinobacteria bacterium]|nr:hypothetical protein [Actinomycetota bacterium]
MKNWSRRLAGIFGSITILASLGSTMGAHASHSYPTALDFTPTPGIACSPDDKPEATQGRVPYSDFQPRTDGTMRASEGYTCNTTKVGQLGSQDGGTGSSGGFRVFRYVDGAHHVCAFFDTTLLFPANVYAAASQGSPTGVWVLDMSHPENPVHTDSLITPAMLSPHESLSLNQQRGLLGAVFANPAFYHGQFDLYDVSQDCLHPTLRSSLPMGVLGHEGSFAPDGNTYYASSLYGHTLTAIDTTDPSITKIVWESASWNVHGMNLSDDGNTLYFADVARNHLDGLEAAGSADKGLTILDVHEVQNRVLNPTVTVIKHITWPHVGTPQTALPIVRDGKNYLVEIDEFGSGDNVGAGRIIDIDDPTDPQVVSNLRLAVNNLANQQTTDQGKDPNANNSLAGYTGHYCAVPQKREPKVVACSFILSGLRVFDISDLTHPKEIAYFNVPATVDKHAANNPPYGMQGSYAMSQ